MYTNLNRFLTVLLLVLTLLLIQQIPDLMAQNITESDITGLLEQAHEKLESADEPAARELFEEILESDPRNFDALWNLSLLYSRQGYRLEERDDMESYFRDAKELAVMAIEYHPAEAESHYVYAVAVGRLADISTPRERVRASEEIKKSVERALELNSEHAGAWHLLGIWHTRAANLTRTERWAANLLFGGAPEGASNHEAEECLKKAIELDAENILFHLDLARFYITVDQPESAIEVLERTISLEPKVMDDPDLLEETRELLSELR
jgi:regulator of microtubule dynamics protein 3